jgi:hypothetical protein
LAIHRFKDDNQYRGRNSQRELHHDLILLISILSLISLRDVVCWKHLYAIGKQWEDNKSITVAYTIDRSKQYFSSSNAKQNLQDSIIGATILLRKTNNKIIKAKKLLWTAREIRNQWTRTARAKIFSRGKWHTPLLLSYRYSQYGVRNTVYGYSSFSHNTPWSRQRTL